MAPLKVGTWVKLTAVGLRENARLYGSHHPKPDMIGQFVVIEPEGGELRLGVVWEGFRGHDLRAYTPSAVWAPKKNGWWCKPSWLKRCSQREATLWLLAK